MVREQAFMICVDRVTHPRKREREERGCGTEDGGVREQSCQGALTQKQTLWGSGALQRGHGAPLEPLAQLRDALGGVGALSKLVQAADLVVG